MISTEVAREAHKIPETLEIRSVPCRLPFQDWLSSAVDFSNSLLGLGTVPITYPLRHIKSRWERAPRNKREIKGQFETRLKRRLLHSVTPAKSMQLVRGIMLCKRTERERREERESPKNQNSADDQKDKLHPVGRQGAGRDRDLHFRG